MTPGLAPIVFSAFSAFMPGSVSAVAFSARATPAPMAPIAAAAPAMKPLRVIPIPIICGSPLPISCDRYRPTWVSLATSWAFAYG